MILYLHLYLFAPLIKVKAKNTDEYDLAEIANHPAFASSLKFDFVLDYLPGKVEI